MRFGEEPNADGGKDNRSGNSGSSLTVTAPEVLLATNKLTQLEDLRALYRSTFEEWALRVGRVDQMHESAQEVDGLTEARVRATEAEVGYRDVRNRLVEVMVAGTTSVHGSENQPQKIRRL